MSTLFGKNYQSVDEILRQRSQERASLFQDTRNRNINATRSPEEFAGAGLGNLFGQAGIALYDKYFGKEATTANDPQLAKAEQDNIAATEVQGLLAKASEDPSTASIHLQKASELAMKMGREDIGLDLMARSEQAGQQQQVIQAQEISRATQQAVVDEGIDPVKDPQRYFSVLAERFGQSRNPLVNQEGEKMREKAIDFTIAAAQAKADADNVEYDAPTGTEVTSSRTFISSRMAVARGRNPIAEEDLDAAAVELSSRAKDAMARDPKLNYTGAVAKTWSEMLQDGTVEQEEKGWFLKKDKYKYVPSDGQVPTATEQAKKQSSEVVRIVNGRPAVFNSDTKQFIRWAD